MWKTRKGQNNRLIYMDDIKNFSKNEKELETQIQTENIQSRYRNGIWHRKICHASNQKWQTTHNGRYRTTKSSTHLNPRRKENLLILGDIGRWHHQANRKERKTKQNKKRIFQKNQNITRDKTLLQELCQRNKYLGCLPCRILGTILEVNQRRRKLMTMHKGLHPRNDVDRLYTSRREAGRGLASIKDSVDTSIQRLEDNIEKRGGSLIAAIRNNSNDTRTSGTTITRNQKWEEKQLYGRFKRLTSYTSLEKTWTWLRKGNYKRENESHLIATQNNAIRTNHSKARIDKVQLQMLVMWG